MVSTRFWFDKSGMSSRQSFIFSVDDATPSARCAISLLAKASLQSNKSGVLPVKLDVRSTKPLLPLFSLIVCSEYMGTPLNSTMNFLCSCQAPVDEAAGPDKHLLHIAMLP